jgi:hypothetical protein
VGLLKPNIALIVNKIQKEAPLRLSHNNSGLRWLNLKEPGYLEQAGSYVEMIPETTFGYYELKIKNTSGLQKLLKDINIVNEEFSIHKPKVSLSLKHLGGGNLDEYSSADLIFEIRDKNQKNMYLEFVSTFFLEKGEIRNINALTYCQKSNFLGIKSPEIISEKNFKKVNKNFDENNLYEVDFFRKIYDIL